MSETMADSHGDSWKTPDVRRAEAVFDNAIERADAAIAKACALNAEAARRDEAAPPGRPPRRRPAREADDGEEGGVSIMRDAW